MANVTITIPDNFITLYNTRRTTYNAYAAPLGIWLMPPATQVALQRVILDWMKQLIRNEDYRADNLPNLTADEAAMTGV